MLSLYNTDNFIKRNNCIIFDYLSFTTTSMSIEDIIILLGFQKLTFLEMHGVKGYSKRMYYDGVSIHYGGQDGKIWVEMSGQGCRVFESYGNGDFLKVFETLLNNSDDNNITRLDVAYDDFKGLINLNEIVVDTSLHNYVTKASKNAWKIELSGDGTCVTIGKHTSNILCRVYDKSAERNRQDEIPHWVRCEIQLRRSHAEQFIKLLCKHQVVLSCDDSIFKGVQIHDGLNLDYLYFSVLNNYLRFIDFNSNEDTNRWRKPMAEHWERFACSVTSDTLSLYVTPGVEYNVLRLDNVVENMYSGAIYTYLVIHGIDDLIKALFKRVPKLNVKYKYLIDNYLRDKQIFEDEQVKEY